MSDEEEGHEFSPYGKTYNWTEENESESLYTFDPYYGLTVGRTEADSLREGKSVRKSKGKSKPKRRRNVLRSDQINDQPFSPYGNPMEEELSGEVLRKVPKEEKGKEKEKEKEKETEEEEESDSDSNSDSESDTDESSTDDTSSDSDSDSDNDSSNEGGLVDSGLVHIPQDLSILSTKYHWNERFGYLTRKLQSDSTTLEKRAELLRNLATLQAEFVRTATLYGKVIISERFVPDKTIPPIDVGGTAGGIKYIKEGILFKFAWDNEGIYEGDMKAMKVATQELNCLKSIYLNLPKGLRVPMMVAIDYRGFKLLAMCLLPVTKTTLIYGSCDGGNVVMASDQQLNAKVAELGAVLNLKEHWVGRTIRQRLCMPADIEVHKGTDGKYYMLDFARVWPPEVPTPGLRASFLIRHLRGELVQSLPKPLCSDSFSTFQSGTEEERRGNNQEVCDAFVHLCNVTIPALAIELEAKILDKENIRQTDLSAWMHEKGANTRHLGVIWYFFTKPEWKRVALTDTSYRVAKRTAQALMRKSMKDIKLATEEPYMRVIVGFLNFLFGNTRASKKYWNTELRLGLEKNYFYLSEGLKVALGNVKDIKREVDLPIMFARLLKNLGVEVVQNLSDRAKLPSFFDMDTVIEYKEIKAIEPIITSGLTEHPDAFVLYKQAYYLPVDIPGRTALLERVCDILHKTARYQSSDHLLTFRYWVKALLGLPTEEMIRAYPQFINYFEWLTENKLRKTSNWNTRQTPRLWQFFQDYLWVLCAINEKYPKRHAARRENYEKLIDPMLTALASCNLPPQEMFRKGMAVLTRQISDELRAELFENLHFEGTRNWLWDNAAEAMVDFIAPNQSETTGGKRITLKGLTFNGTDELSWNFLQSVICRFDAATTLQSLQISRARSSQLCVLSSANLTELLSLAPNLRRLILVDLAMTTSVNDHRRMIPLIVDTLPNLTELQINQLPLMARPDKPDWLSQMEVLMVGEVEDLFCGVYDTHNLRELVVDGYDHFEISMPLSLAGFSNLRRLVLFTKQNKFLPPEFCEQMTLHCQQLVEFDTEFCISPLGMGYLSLATRLERLGIGALVNEAGEFDGAAEKESFILFASKFSALKRLRIRGTEDIKAGLLGVVIAHNDTTPTTQQPQQPLPYLESLYIRDGSESCASEWLQLAGVLRGSLQDVLLPDLNDAHVEDLKNSLDRKKVQVLDMMFTSFTVEGIKILLKHFTRLRKIRLPYRMGYPEVVMVSTCFSSTLREVRCELENRSLGEPVLSTSERNRFSGRLPMLVVLSRVDAKWVKLTCPLGRDDDIIDPFGWLRIGDRAMPKETEPAELSRLRAIQSLYWDVDVHAT